MAFASTQCLAQPDPTDEPIRVASVAESTTGDAPLTSDPIAGGDVARRPVNRELAKQKLAQLIAETKTVKWTAKARESLGDKVEESTAEVCWASAELQRVEVTSGRAAGKTLIVRDDYVHVGWLKFRHTNRMVQTLRGNSLKRNGFIDDIQHMLSDWEKVTLTDDAGLWILSYQAPAGMDAKMWLNPVTMKVSKTETYEDGCVAGCYEYESIAYNDDLPPSTWCE